MKPITIYSPSTIITLKEMAMKALKEAYDNRDKDEYEVYFGVAVDLNCDVSEYGNFYHILEAEEYEYKGEMLRDAMNDYDSDSL